MPSETPKLDRVMLFVLRFMQKRERLPIQATQFMKLLYFIDCEGMRQLGRPITEERWSREEQGPLVGEFYEARNRLLADGLITLSETPLDPAEGRRHHLHGLPDEFVKPDDPYAEETFCPAGDFSMAEETVIRLSLARTYELSPEELKVQSYETPPMRAAREREAAAGGIQKGAPLLLHSVSQNKLMKAVQRLTGG